MAARKVYLDQFGERCHALEMIDWLSDKPQAAEPSAILRAASNDGARFPRKLKAAVVTLIFPHHCSVRSTDAWGSCTLAETRNCHH